MSITELITKVGAENIVLQNIGNDCVDLKVNKHCGVITFNTDKAKVQDLMSASMTGSRTKFVGLILWIPRDKIDVQPTETPVSREVKHPSPKNNCCMTEEKDIE